MKNKWTYFSLLLFVVLAFVALQWGNDLLIAIESNAPSISSGTTADGTILNAKRIPSHGVNFSSYSRLGSLIGRTCVHEKVRAVILESYSQVFQRLPDRQFVYGETGWPHGGKFWPHKTHENGLSVDFMVPVLTRNGSPTIMSTTLFNRFGYDVEFDSLGNSSQYSIDFKAMAMHLQMISESAHRNGCGVRVVIFDTALQRRLFSTTAGHDLPNILHFSVKPAWVRHDEHYHIDFTLLEPKMSR